MSVRWKAGLIVLPTVLVAVVSAGFGLWSSVGEARAAKSAGDLFAVGASATEVTQRLQAERIAAVGLLLPGSKVKPADFERAVQRADEAISGFRVLRGDLEDPPGGVRAVLARADAGLADVQAQRQRVRGDGPVALSAVAFGYRIVIADLGDLLLTVAQSGVEPQLADEMRASATASRAREAVGQQQVAVLQAVAARRLTPALHAEIVAARSGQDEALREFDALARPSWRARLGRTLTGGDVLAAVRLDGLVSGTGVYEPVRLPGGAEQWSRVMTTRADLLAQVQATVNADIAAAADDLWMAQVRAAAVQAAILLLMLLVAAVTAVRVARSLVAQLSSLEQGARRVADVELPALVARLRATSDPAAAARLAEGAGGVAVPVVGRDEVGQLAGAFNLVLVAAVDAAVGQARGRALVSAMITSVGRRVQTLTDQLLASIDRLERDEANPDRLEMVFAADQQATQLRRYGSNLLIVAGGGPAQSQPSPVVLADLVNAALSEIEGFARITTGQLVEVEIDARAVYAVKSILAELLDNATRFSADQVRVVAGWSGHDVQILVVDSGLGMIPEQFDRANALLASPEIEVAVTDQMGLVVTSRLAARFGVRVRLGASQPTGVTAEVLVPAEYVTRVHVREIVVPSQIQRPTRPAPEPAPHPAVATPWAGTGWTGQTQQMPVVPAPPASPSADMTMELPPVPRQRGPVSLPVGAPLPPDPPMFQAMAAKSPWLWPSRSDERGFSTDADAGWQAAASAAEPATDGRTTSGLPRRRPQAHVVPGGLPAQRTPSEPYVQIDPAAIRAQVAGTMRGLRAVPSTPPLPTGERR
ncbi:nitrate- and nitrite sensing domain-containing protein [Micromonospora sp. DH14]|uniref:sensor histidine kinase n=1 Tax=Micromonospora sp. DH14 TaxID=3040120 RepID=UPI0024418699|nr:nitrate- and nitrite sensing domain-containing protein [Micromonospora sp. DH14]MDG9674779.1 nitrate- and nitrite sensing domain-containing protein [Micromonospora sp. DH14]